MLIGTEAKRYDRVTVRILPFKDTGGGRTRTNGIFLLLTLLTFLLVLASFESVTFIQRPPVPNTLGFLPYTYSRNYSNSTLR